MSERDELSEDVRRLIEKQPINNLACCTQAEPEPKNYGQGESGLFSRRDEKEAVCQAVST